MLPNSSSSTLLDGTESNESSDSLECSSAASTEANPAQHQLDLLDLTASPLGRSRQPMPGARINHMQRWLTRVATGLVVAISISCQKNPVAPASACAALQGIYRATYGFGDCQGSPEVTLQQQGCTVAFDVPGLGHVEGVASPSGISPRLRSSRLTITACPLGTLEVDPVDDGVSRMWHVLLGPIGCRPCTFGSQYLTLTLNPLAIISF